MDGLRKTPALDEAQVLPDRVDLDDVGAAGQQDPVRFLLVVERDFRNRKRHERGASPRDAGEHEIVRAGLSREGEDLFRRAHPALVGDRVAREAHSDMRQAPLLPVLARDDPLRDPVPEDVVERRGDGEGRLPGAEDVDIAEAVETVRRVSDEERPSVDAHQIARRLSGVRAEEPRVQNVERVSSQPAVPVGDKPIVIFEIVHTDHLQGRFE